MLYLITGPNGGGKSLRSIQLMHELHAKGIQIFAWGYHGLKLDWVDQTLNPRDWQDMPPGSAMFVDEAQKLWRTRRGSKEPPPELMEMEEHRYQGVDLYLISQDPGYIDSHIKGLVSKHWHCIPYGNACSRVFEFNECQDNPQNMTKRAHAGFEVWKHPKKYYQCYESAMFHMAKPKIPWRHRLPKLMLYGAGLLFLGIVALLATDWQPSFLSFGKAQAATTTARGSEAGAGFFGLRAAGRRRPATVEEYAAELAPRIPEMPYSAPIFDDRKAKADPRLFCMSTRDTCTCMTEQGTRYQLENQRCRYLARWGAPYNPFLDPRKDERRSGGVGGEPPSAAVPPIATGPAVGDALASPVLGGSAAP